MRLPHVRADEGDLGDDFLAHGGEESLEGFDGPFSPDPEQTGDADVDLIDGSRPVCLPSAYLPAAFAAASSSATRAPCSVLPSE
jgi:hypothetical protein